MVRQDLASQMINTALGTHPSERDVYRSARTVSIEVELRLQCDPVKVVKSSKICIDVSRE